MEVEPLLIPRARPQVADQQAPQQAEAIEPLMIPRMSQQPQGIQGIGDIATHGALGTAQALMSIPALPAMAYAGADRLIRGVTGTDEQYLPGAGKTEDLLGSYLNLPYQMAGVEQPDTTSERLAATIPSLLIPGTAAVKGAKMLGKGAEMAAQALSPVLPFAQTTSKVGRAAEAGLTMGVQEVGGYLQDQPSVFNQAPGMGTNPGGINPVAAQPPAAGPIEPILIPRMPVRSPDAQHVDQVLEVPPVGDPDNRMSNLFLGTLGVLGAVGIRGVYTANRKAREAARIIEGRPTGGAPGGPVAGQVFEPPAASVTEPQVLDVNTLQGPLTGKGTIGAIQSNDSLAALENMLDQSPDPPGIIAQIRARIRTAGIYQSTAKVDDTLETGRMPASGIKLPHRPADLFMEVRTFDPDKMTAFDEISTLGSALDQSERIRDNAIGRLTTAMASLKPGTRPHTIKSALVSKLMTTGVPWKHGADKSRTLTYRDMVERYAALRAAHPDVAMNVDKWSENYKHVAKWLKEQGQITDRVYQEFIEKNHRYAPRMQHYRPGIDAQGLGKLKAKGQKLATWLSGGDLSSFAGRFMDTGSLKERGNMNAGASIGPGDVGPQVLSHAKYFNDVIRGATMNSTTRDLLDIGTRINVSGKPIVKRIGPRFAPPKVGDPKNMNKYMSIKEAGEEVWYSVDDPAVFSALHWKPRTALPLISKAQQLIANFQVGLANPVWLTRHLWYESHTGAANLPKGRSLGVLSGALKTVGLTGKAGLSSFDPTNYLVAPLTGAGRAMWAETMNGVRNSLQQSLLNNGFLSQALGPANTQALADAAAAAFERSTLANMRRYGGVSYGRGSTVLDNINMINPVLDRLWGGGMRNSAPGRLYLSLLDAIKLGQKVQFFATNTERKWQWRPTTFVAGKTSKTWHLPTFETISTPEELNILAREARELTGDAARIPGDVATKTGKIVQKTTDAFLYSNSFLQAQAQTVRAIKDHKARWVTTKLLTGSAYAGALYWAASTDEGKELLQQMTPEQLGRYIPVVDGDGKLIAMVSTLQEDRPFLAMIGQMILGATGVLSPDEHEDTHNVYNTFVSSLWSDVVPDFTSNPLTDIGFWYAGKRVKGQGSFETADLPEERVHKLGDPDSLESGLHTLDSFTDAVIGGAMTAYMDAAKMMYAGFKEGYGMKDVAEAGLDTLQYNFAEAKTAGILNTLWGIGLKSSVSDTIGKRVSSVVPTLQQIISQGDETVMKGGMGSRVGTANLQGFSSDQRSDPTFPIIWSQTKGLQSAIAPFQQEYKDLTTEHEKITKNPAYSDPRRRLDAENRITERKQQLNQSILTFIKKSEELISLQTGEEFSYDTWKP